MHGVGMRRYVSFAGNPEGLTQRRENKVDKEEAHIADSCK